MDLQVRAVAKYIRMSPRKVKLVVDLVRGKQVAEALTLLKYSTKAAARPVAKAIQSAAANAEDKFGLSPQELYIAEIYADEGPTYKRGRFGARGRFKPILKRSTHITVVLGGLGQGSE
nr:50S ribosomal protein L22 [Chloroflexota bacterium]